MGLITAALSAVGGGLADQWLEVVEAADMGEGIGLANGSRKCSISIYRKSRALSSVRLIRSSILIISIMRSFFCGHSETTPSR